MRIDFKKLDKAGFRVDVMDDGIEIYPINHKSPDALINLLRSEYGILPVFAYAMVDDLHDYQVMSALKT
jgi:hypothetical protein